jgi:hypothetical protein
MYTNYTGQQKNFLILPAKMKGDLYTLDVAEYKHGN